MAKTISKIITAAALFAFGIVSADTTQAAPRSARTATPERIACTVLGCMPVPRECGITYGRSMNGTPTGYDVIVCPPGVWPLK